ncbi:MAG: phosphoglycerate dehydrogenase [Myxococcota bacterium]|nr:phosphoglycerate dehydrogenase [Deltaproteobacteria bacterium]MDQ3339379.1 phosphoglycerate dehydrogenase [Myxococcota bacterium]
MAAIVAWSTSSFGKESPRPLELLKTAGYDVRANPHGRTLTTDEAKAHLDGVVGLVAGTEKLTGELMRSLPALRCISRVGVGMDSIDHAAAKECGIVVVNTPDAHVDAVAELTLAGLMAILRKIPTSDASIRSGGFEKPMGRLLGGKTIGLVGCGRVGRRFAELVAGFGVTILAHDPQVTAAPPGVALSSLDDLVAMADIVSLHLPYSAAAKHLLGADQLARMKKDAVVVNTSRGGLIDEAALLAFLEANPKAGAYLDCFEKEPYSGPLAKLPNVVATAHIGSYAREARVRMEVEAVENLLRHLKPM